MPVGLINSALLVLLRESLRFLAALTLESYRVIEKIQTLFPFFLLLITLNPIFGNVLADVSDWRFFGAQKDFSVPLCCKS